MFTPTAPFQVGLMRQLLLASLPQQDVCAEDYYSYNAEDYKNTYYISQGKRTTCLCSLGDQNLQALNTWLMSLRKGPEAVNLNLPDGSREDSEHKGRGVKKRSQGAGVY